jgi:endonuclease YncB( thermonuclease family)
MITLSKTTLTLSILFLFGLFMMQRFPRHGEPLASLPEVPQTCTGLIVYDGDTFGCDMNGNNRVDGKHEQIRLLGIDASEMHYSRKNKTGKNQPFAVEAKSFVERAVLNQEVKLVFDTTPIDKYGRWLAFASSAKQPDVILNESLLKQGLAKTLFIGANRQHEEEYAALQSDAQKHHLGLWKGSAP